ncbi:BMP family protein [Nocardioides abyssi]|uniref:BMP family protein n=1 Tax=Nocardioides abyssi TaxID=3058370 RepID=A0ABT8EP56_9ACTN|nr:BMP family protein [Nocardioides abyssi]MDN4159909.1 BMP family protein [Nocardioides abyssi]
MRPVRLAAVATALTMGLALAGCGGSDEGGDGGGDKVAGIFSGPVTDADLNALGLDALKAAEKDGASVSYAESVAVPDIEGKLRQYVSSGYSVVWTHGSQFYDATAKVAKENPDVNFIAEFDGVPEDQPENLWVIDRNFHTVFYPLGVLAANLSSSGKVGYLGGLSLPFSYAEVHALEQGIEDSGKDADLKPVWTGDFNDTVKATQFTSQLLSGGNDIIVTSLNLGVVGAFEAMKGTEAGKNWITVKYTDKSANDPEHYAATVLYDFATPLQSILDEIEGGTTSGVYVMGFGKGADVSIGDNVPEDAKKAAEKAVADVESGATEVELDQSEVK